MSNVAAGNRERASHPPTLSMKFRKNLHLPRPFLRARFPSDRKAKLILVLQRIFKRRRNNYQGGIDFFQGGEKNWSNVVGAICEREAGRGGCRSL